VLNQSLGEKNMILTEAIRKRIYDLCSQRNITINKLSTICGMTQSTLNNIFMRKNAKPTVSTIKKIFDGLDITLKDFFDTDYFDLSEQEIK